MNEISKPELQEQQPEPVLQFEVSAYGRTYELKAQRIEDAVYLTQPAYEDRDDPGADDEIVLDRATLIALLKMYEEEACAAV